MHTENKMRLVVVEFNSSGGLMHYAYQLCSALAGQALDVTLVTGTDYELQKFPHNFHVENILKVWPVFDPASMETPPTNPLLRKWRKIKWLFRRGIRAARLIGEWVRLTRYLIKLKPDIIQFGEIKFPFESVFLSRLSKNGLILSQICHEFEHRESQGYFSSLIDRMYVATFKHFSAIFFHANENRERFLSAFNYPAENIHVIPHGNETFFLKAAAKIRGGEDLRQRYGLQENERVVLFFGMLTPSKGLPDLIDAFAIVRQHSSVKLVIAGYPSKYIDVNALRTQVSDHELLDQVIFDNRYIPIESIGRLMELATLVVYPYRNATQSGSLQVAYAFGRPVIATKVGGLPEVVEDGRSGFLVPPRAPDKLAKKIVELVNSPDLADQMGRYARQLSVSRYGWEPIAKQIAEVYQHLVRK